MPTTARAESLLLRIGSFCHNPPRQSTFRGSQAEAWETVGSWSPGTSRCSKKFMSLDPPSSELLRALAALGIEAAQVLECQTQARQLSGGLPIIDSLWVDALVASERLSPLQARWLEAGAAARLVVGEGWTISAPRHLDPVCSLFDVRRGSERALVTEIPLTGDELTAAAPRVRLALRNLEAAGGALHLPPRELFLRDDALLVISPHFPGETLGRLLVRRGRFSEDVVRSLALELVRQLASGETHALHGDLRLSNILLTSDGRIGLLNWGILAAARPSPTLRTPLPVDAGDGFAPERLIADRRPTSAADVYACGCLLWQLLAGRPPFLSADPVQKRLAHQSRGIPDVRTIAAGTSPALAELIRSMTSREPERRPQRFAEVLTTLQSGLRTSRSSLREFSESFSRPVSRRTGNSSRGRPQLATLATAVAITFLAIGLAWNRSFLGWPQLTNLGAETATDATRFAPLPEDHSLPLLPAADGSGLVTLQPGTRYTASDLTAAGELVLRAPGDSPAVIVVGGSPLSLTADRVTLDNCLITTDPHGTAPSALLNIKAQELRLRRCRVSGAGGARPAQLIDWTALQPEDPRSCRLLIVECVLEQGDTGLRVRSPLTTALCDQVLVTGVTRFLELDSSARAGLRVPLMWRNCTLRTDGPLVSVAGESLEKSGRLSLQGTNTVLAAVASGSLLEIVGGDPAGNWESHLEIAAESLLCPEECSLAGYRTASGAPLLPLDTGRMTAEGVLSGRFHFEHSLPPADPRVQLVIDFLPVRSEGLGWGAEEARLPAPEAVP